MKIGYKLDKISWKFRLYLWLSFSVLQSTLLFLFGLFTDGEPGLHSSIVQGIIAGGFFAFVFPFAMMQISGSLDSKIWKQLTPNLKEDETVCVEGPASLFRDLEAVGGKLYITNKRLIFKPHRFNYQKTELVLQQSSIYSVAKRKTLRLVDNGISVNTNDGKQFKFIVNERDTWLSNILQNLEIPIKEEPINII